MTPWPSKKDRVKGKPLLSILKAAARGGDLDYPSYYSVYSAMEFWADCRWGGGDDEEGFEWLVKGAVWGTVHGILQEDMVEWGKGRVYGLTTPGPMFG